MDTHELYFRMNDARNRMNWTAGAALAKRWFAWVERRFSN